MNSKQKEVLQSELNNEKKVIKELEQVYQQAIKDCERKIRELSMRSDMENLQSIVYQKQYQQAIKGQLEGVLSQLHSNEFATVSEYLNKCYTTGFAGSMYDLTGQGIPLIVPISHEQILKAIQTDSKLSKTLYESLGEDVSKLKTAVRAQVSRGISNGSSWNDIAKTLAERNMKNTPFGTAINNATRIVRTEGHRVQTSAKMDAMKEAKKKGADVVKQWDSTLDGNTRTNHRILDGQIREIDEPFEVGGMEVDAPGYFGDPAEDCNCRCAVLQRAKWALDDSELETLQQRAEYFGLDKTEDFEDYKSKYLNISEEDIEKAEKDDKIKEDEHSEMYNILKEMLEDEGVEYNEVKMHDTSLSEKEIIKALGGGDMTQGSCASVGLAYVGQKLGMDVLDFRGGESQGFFSSKLNLDGIMQFVPDEKVIHAFAKSYITSGNKILKQAEKGKQYYFYCGRHAAVVRRTDEGKLQYLELQSKNDNGWTDFDGNPRHTLATRFGCTAADWKVSGTMVDIEAFKDSKDFKSILGYINTSSKNQKKGAGGHEK